MKAIRCRQGITVSSEYARLTKEVHYMDWIKATEAAIQYIEENITENLTVSGFIREHS